VYVARVSLDAALPVHESVDDSIGRNATMARAERLALGASRRRDVALDEHARLPAVAERVDPVATLTTQDANRLPELVPIRHGRMSASPFTFYRGAAAVMAADLTTVPSSGLWVQLCGDAHLANFGLFNGPDRRLVFDLNDFDETHPGPFEWDVKRLAASVVVAARDNGASGEKARRAATATVAGYRAAMTEISMFDPLTLHYFRIEFDQIMELVRQDRREQSAKVAEKARSKNSLKAVARLTEIVDGRRRIVDAPPLVTRVELEGPVRQEAEAFFAEYFRSLPLARRRVLERYAMVDVARKVVGVGSVGTRCLILLCETADGDPLFLQLKEATTSVLEPHLGASAFDEHGERVVQGQRLMQTAGDVFLGWGRFHSSAQQRSVDFYVRQLWDGKGSADIATMRSRTLRIYGELCGRTLALAHARTGDAAAISGYLGDDATFDEAVASFAEAYADLTDADHRAHVAAIAAGDVTVIRDL
jgi:uncharacterized protein (DUF2252 family)